MSTLAIALGTSVSISQANPSLPGPTAPSGLAAVSNSPTTVDLSWTDNSGDETGFEVERSLTGIGGWSLITTTAADATTYQDTGLSEGTEYFYRVRAINGEGNSRWSNVASDTTSTASMLDFSNVANVINFVLKFWG